MAKRVTLVLESVDFIWMCGYVGSSSRGHLCGLKRAMHAMFVFRLSNCTLVMRSPTNREGTIPVIQLSKTGAVETAHLSMRWGRSDRGEVSFFDRCYPVMAPHHQE